MLSTLVYDELTRAHLNGDMAVEMDEAHRPNFKAFKITDTSMDGQPFLYSQAHYRGDVTHYVDTLHNIANSASAEGVDRRTSAMADYLYNLYQPAALLTGKPPGVAQAVRAIEQAGRRPVLLGPTRASVSLPGSAAQQVVSLRTAADARTLTGAPTGNGKVTYSLWLAATPSAGPV